VGFEPTIPVSERPQTHALDRAATAIGSPIILTFTNLLILTAIMFHLVELNPVLTQSLIKVTVKFSLERAMKVQRERRGIALLFL
jgi:hypothetical protein